MSADIEKFEKIAAYIENIAAKVSEDLELDSRMGGEPDEDGLRGVTLLQVDWDNFIAQAPHIVAFLRGWGAALGEATQTRTAAARAT